MPKTTPAHNLAGRDKKAPCPTDSVSAGIQRIALFLLMMVVPALVAGFFITVQAQPLKPLAESTPNPPWEITADQIQYDTQAERYIAKGNVIIQKADKKLSADFVRFDQKTMQAHASGHIVMTSGNDILCGDRIDINLNSETGTLFNGTLFHSETNFYIQGDRIEKIGKNSYRAQKVNISTCDGDHPDWRITGRDLKITIEGYGTVKHAALWAKGLPVMYTPWFAFPVKLKRQSGLLSPQMSFGDRKGTEVIQPVYWAINKNTDATFYEHYMANRGNKLGLEYRYILSKESKGALMIDFFHDRQIDDGTGNTTSSWGYDDDEYLRTNRDRYWFRMKHDQALGVGFTAKLDLDIVSDQDYLTEFKDGITGFNDSKEYFNDTFGRGFDDYNDSTRLNRFNLNKIGNSYSLNAEMRWYDDVLKRRWETADDTLQQLPFIGFDISRKQFRESPLYYALDSEYTYFYRESGTRGHRMDIHPRLYLPWTCKGYFTVEPSVGLRQTAWLADRYEDEDAAKDDFALRTIYDIKLDLATDLYRVYTASVSGGRTWRHRLTPRVVYDYIPNQNQDEYPDFDDIDRIDSQNTITYSITNTLTSKQLMPANDNSGKSMDQLPSALYRYKQFCRIKLEQSYDVDEAREPSGEPFSPISGELELKPSDMISLQADAQWSVYENDLVSNNVTLKLTNGRKDELSVEYRHQNSEDKDDADDDEDEETHSLYMNGLINLGDRWALFSEYEHNFEDGDDLTVAAGFRYRAGCWSFECKYSDESGDRKYAFMFTLNGLGNIGTSL
jgi:LPS-assembly protein